jgi:hypothetical protein
MDLEFQFAITENPACRFPGSSQAGTQSTINGDAGEQITHCVRLRLPILVERHIIRIRNGIAILVDIVHRTVTKQIYAAALCAIEGYAPGFHVSFQ